jgi:hypothetical protein
MSQPMWKLSAPGLFRSPTGKSAAFSAGVVPSSHWRVVRPTL